MYKIVNITDREGNVKQDFIDKLREIHPNMSGEIVHEALFKNHICMDFKWNDDSGKILETSIIEEYEKDENKIRVVTMNSIYYLEKENN